jgi:hypothetical protein
VPRYFFHVHDGTDVPDLEGTELRDITAARAQGLMLAGEIIRDAGRRGDLGEDWSIEVSDQGGLVLFRMVFLVAASPATERNS